MVPSWMNERRRGVNVGRTLWTANLASLLTYATFGILGACSLVHADDNVLANMTASNKALWTRLTAVLFAVLIIGLGVPVQSVIMKYNLSDATGGGVLPPRGAAFVAAGLPYLVAWSLYQGHAALGVVAWTGTLFNGAVNLVLPLLLALAAAAAAPACCDRRAADASAANSSTRRMKAFELAGYEPAPELLQRQGLLQPLLAPPDASSVPPLPRWLEPARRKVIALLLLLVLPAIVVGLAVLTIDDLQDASAGSGSAAIALASLNAWTR